MRHLPGAEVQAFTRCSSGISASYRNTMSFTPSRSSHRAYAENEASHLLHHCFDAAQRYTFALQHTAKHRYCRLARGVFHVKTRRNLGRTLECPIARWL